MTSHSNFHPPRHTNHPVLRALCWALPALLAACGGGGGGGGSEAPAPNIGPDGGSVATADQRITLSVPAGAASAPMRVTLTPEPAAAVPAGASVLAETIVRIDGDGGPLAAPATLDFTAAAPFPPGPWLARAAGAQAPAGARARPLTITLREPECDIDGDGDIDQADQALMYGGASCYAPPTLVALQSQLVELISVCNPSVGLTARCTINSLAARRLALNYDPIAPTVSANEVDFPTAPAPITQAGEYHFGVNATDNKGVVRVEFYKTRLFRNNVTRELITTQTEPPYRATFTLSEADNGVQAIVAYAFDAAGNMGGRGGPVVVSIQPGPPPDTTPPTVGLAASAGSVLVGGSVTLAATATDDVAVAKVAFYRDGNKIGEDTSAPYEFAPPAFTGADLGTVSYTAVATDTAGNSATSAAASVVVSAPAATEFYVSTTGDDNAAGTSAAPVRTLAKAFALAGPGGTVWLKDGVYTGAGEGLAPPDIPVGRTLPAGATLRAVNDGAATLGFTLNVPGGGSIVGLNFDTSSMGRVRASGGALQLSRPQWVKLGTTTLGHGVEASGTAQVRIDPKGLATHNYVAAGLTGFASATGSAELRIEGGVLDGSSGQSGGIALDDTATLTLLNFVLRNDSGAWVGGTGAVSALGTANQVWIENTTIDLANAGGVCVLQDRNLVGNNGVTTAITLKNATLTRCGGGTVQLREGTPSLLVEASVLSAGGRAGIETGQIGFDSTTGQYARPTISLVGGSVHGHVTGAVRMNQGGTLTVNGSTLAGGDAQAVQLQGAKPYQLTMRGATITGNTVGLLLAGDGTSSLDLGTAANPGQNSLLAAPGLRLATAAGVLTRAVGNAWRPNVQGAGGDGQYTSASSVCANANPCDLASGTGSNFDFVGAGAGALLRLVGP